jgi:hypothetical protein
MTRLIISLTTIPPRFPYLLENLKCLLRQTALVESINLYIPRTYRRFTYSTKQIPSLPEGVALHIIDEDLGPATKILPACKQYKGQDVFILFGDDTRFTTGTGPNAFSMQPSSTLVTPSAKKVLLSIQPIPNRMNTGNQV